MQFVDVSYALFVFLIFNPCHFTCFFRRHISALKFSLLNSSILSRPNILFHLLTGRPQSGASSSGAGGRPSSASGGTYAGGGWGAGKGPHPYANTHNSAGAAGASSGPGGPYGWKDEPEDFYDKFERFKVRYCAFLVYLIYCGAYMCERP